MLKENLQAAVDKQLPILNKIADAIFEHPELGPSEVMASGLLTDYLEGQGFTLTRGLAGLDTAFKAVWHNGEGGPNIGLMCEYDALAKIGHACGHHMQGPSILAAAVAMKECAGPSPFTLTVYGTPGEENISGKYIMIKNGCDFSELDFALMMHGGPATQTDIKCLAAVKYEVEFKGKASHAALKPEDGRSSLDAMLLAFHGIECLREHVKDDVRMHYNITDAGGTPANVVPSLTKADVYLRANETEYLETVKERFVKVLQGAALMTETVLNYTVGKQLDNKIPNYTLNDILMENAKALKAPCCRPPREKTGSTDFANVMHRIPGSCIRVAFVPEGTASHSDAYVAAGKSPAAYKAIEMGAKIIACAVADILARPELLTQIKEEFQERLAQAQKSI